MAEKLDYRLRIERQGTNKYRTYVVRRGKRVDYIGGDETPLALSNLVHSEAAELTFALEDASDGNAAAKAVRAVLDAQWASNPTMTPKVTVL